MRGDERAAQGSVLLTGFGPFPGVGDNATARLVPALAERAAHRLPALAVHFEILDTLWDHAPRRVSELIALHRPALALHFGVAREATGFRIERVARNACRIAPDAAGALPSLGLLVEGGAEHHACGIDTDAIARSLARQGLPVSLSDDAGGYLCNAVLYHSLAAAQQLADAAGAACRAGFIHIPADLSGPPLSFSEALEGSWRIIETCLADAPARGQS